MDGKTVLFILAFTVLIFLMAMLLIGRIFEYDEKTRERAKMRIKNKLRKKKCVEVPIDCYANIDNIKKRIDIRIKTITNLIQRYSEERASLGDISFSTRLLYDSSYDFNTDKKDIIQYLDELEDYLYMYRKYYEDSNKL